MISSLTYHLKHYFVYFPAQKYAKLIYRGRKRKRGGGGTVCQFDNVRFKSGWYMCQEQNLF